MNEAGLTPAQLKEVHHEEIIERRTFATHGLSKQAAIEYLGTPEGALFRRRLVEADTTAPADLINKRALEQLTSGRELPRTEVISEPLAKIVPAGTKPSDHSPFFAKLSEIEDALKAGHRLSDRFGLPVASEASRYDVFQIKPLAPTEVFVNTIAPTSELNGSVIKAGGAEQYLVPNRKLYTAPTYLKSVDNQLFLHAGLGGVHGAGSRPGMSASREGGHPSGRVAGMAGIVATGIDAIQTTRQAAGLLDQGNAVGAQSQVLHFSGRNLGAWGGAMLGAQVFGAAGAETGPADLLIGGLGMVVGAIAGDELADAVDRQRIYRQTGPDGLAWHYDPANPAQGWTRTSREIDGAAMRLNDGFPVYHERTFSADAPLADELNYQASSTAVELALAHAPTPQAPYRQPSGPADVHSLRTSPWVRDAQTRAWTREVTTQVLEHGIVISHVEEASPARSAELEQAAAQTIEDNQAHSQRAIAGRYQAAYEAYGWNRHGPMPLDVSGALDTPISTVRASDGQTYTRDARGGWSTPGWLYGQNAAGAPVAAELEATWRHERAVLAHRARQAAEPAPGVQASTDVAEHGRSATQAGAVARTNTEPALEPDRLAPSGKTDAGQRPVGSESGATFIPEHLRDFRHGRHPAHADYRHALSKVHAMEDHARIDHGEHSERLAAKLVDLLHQERFGGLERVELRGRGEHMQAVAIAHRPSYYMPQREVAIGVAEATACPAEQSARAWSRRALPHLHAKGPAEDRDAVPGEVPNLEAHDLRRADHPGHAQFQALCGRIGDLYAGVGIARSPAQLEQTSAAVMLSARRALIDWSKPADLSLPPDRQTGVISPQGTLFVRQSCGPLPVLAGTSAQDMQRAPAESFQQLAQVEQQRSQVSCEPQQAQPEAVTR